MTKDWLEGGPLEGSHGEVVTKSKLVQITGLSNGAVERAIAEGAPIVSRGSRNLGWQINTADFLHWYIKWKRGEVSRDDSPIAEARRRLAVARANTAEDRVKELREKTITWAEARKAIKEQMDIVTKHTLAFPAQIAPALVGVDDVTKIENIVDDAVNKILANICDQE